MRTGWPVAGRHVPGGTSRSAFCLPVTLESVDTPGFFLSWKGPAIFVAGVFGGALIKDLVADNVQTYTSIGFQLDLQFTLVRRLPMTLSAGYAAGFRNGTKLDDEIILSLKML